MVNEFGTNIIFGIVIRILVHMLISTIRPKGKGEPIVLPGIAILVVVLLGDDVYKHFTLVNLGFALGFFFLEALRLMRESINMLNKSEEKTKNNDVKRKPRVHKIDGRKVQFNRKETKNDTCN